MTNTLLRTKLQKPQSPPGLVARLHLLAKLDRILEKRLAVVSTPAGYGKSTLVASWAEQKDLPLAWLSLDESDDDLTRYFMHMIAAVERVVWGFGQSLLSWMDSPQPPTTELFLKHFINELYEIGHDCVLVLDDFHLIQGVEIHNALEFLVGYMPPQFHLIIASRAELPFSVANLRAQDQIVEITQFEMRFSEEEAFQYINQRMGLSLSRQEIKTLVHRTEGWIVGLHLATLSLLEEESTSRFLQDLSAEDRYIREYLLDEVFSRQPKEIQDFLLKSSLCQRFTAEMCDAILCIDQSREFLHTLERLNLFIIPLDHQRDWYRYHHLFSEMLLSRLKKESPESIPEICSRASIWCEQEGLLAEAVEYALRAGDYSSAAELIVKIGKETLWRGSPDQLLRWLKGLPDHIYRGYPSLLPLHLWALIILGRFSQAATELEEGKLEKDLLRGLEGEEKMKFGGWMATIRALLAMNFHYDMAVGKKEAWIGVDSQIEYDELGLMAPLIYGKACMWSDDLLIAEPYLECSLSEMKRSNSPFMIMIATHHLGEFALLKGDLQRADDLLQQAYQFGLQHNYGDTSAFGKISADLGRLHYERFDMVAAQHFLAAGIRAAEHYMVAYDLIEGYSEMFDLACHERNLEAANRVIRSVEELGRNSSFAPAIMARAEAMKARVALLEGNWRAAQRWLQGSDLLDRDGFEFYQSYEVLTAIRVLHALRDFSFAKDLCVKLLERMEGQHRLREIVHLKTWLATILDQLGEFRASEDILREAVEIGANEGYIHSMIDVGEPIKDLLVRFRNYRRAHLQEKGQDLIDEYLQQVISAQLSKVLSDGLSGFVGISADLSEPLTEREAQVLKLLAKGHSNQEIASLIMVSQSTVKYHLKNIYLKLGVRSRTQAIAHAGELRLV